MVKMINFMLYIVYYNFFFINFIYLFLAALGPCCCAQAFSSCGEQGPLFVVVRSLLIAVASLVAEHRLQAHRESFLNKTNLCPGSTPRNSNSFDSEVRPRHQ